MNKDMSDTNPEIRFRPLHEGLGFHPFKEGLPYSAPKTATPRPSVAPMPSTPMGTGAEAAGRPRFVQPSALNLAPTARPTASAVSSAVTPALGVAYVLKRVLAYLIDLAIDLAVFATALSIAMGAHVSWRALWEPGAFLIAASFFALCHWASLTAQEVGFGTTLGKRLFGLRLSGNAREVFIRSLLSIPSFALLGFGLWSALWDERHRCWHDRMIHLQPEERARWR